MIPVSSGWIAAHKETLLPEMLLEVIYGVTEPGLQEDATASSTTEAEFSDAAQIVSPADKTSETYATLEGGLWGLDGSFSYLDTPTDPGYVSEVLSGADGSFTDYPTITINFGLQHTELIPGITITWSDVYNEWATDFRVTAYNAGVEVARTEVHGNTSTISVVNVDLSTYNRIVIEVLGWSLPYHRARCIEIYLGVEKIYSKTDLMKYEHSQSADLLSAALPKNSITFDLRNDDARWNPDSPTGSEQYLMERQEIKVRYGMRVGNTIEWIPGGTFWLSEWSTPANGMSASFTARDALEFMDEVYTGSRSGNLYEIAVEALTQAALPSYDDGGPRFIVDESLEDIYTDFSEDTSDFTVAQILQMVAHAGCCVFYQDRYGMVRLEPWKDVYSGYMIEPIISYKYPEYTISKPLKAVLVKYGEDNRKLLEVNPNGAVQTVENVMLRTENDADRVAEKTKAILENRKVITGDFRADVRLDVLDNIIVTSKYASNIIGVTDIKYTTTGGSFKGTYTGRVVSINLEPADRRSNEFYLGEV